MGSCNDSMPVGDIFAVWRQEDIGGKLGAMCAFVEFLDKNAKDGICTAWSYGDWLSMDGLDGDVAKREIEKSADPKASGKYREGRGV